MQLLERFFAFITHPQAITWSDKNFALLQAVLDALLIV